MLSQATVDVPPAGRILREPYHRTPEEMHKITAHAMKYGTPFKGQGVGAMLDNFGSELNKIRSGKMRMNGKRHIVVDIYAQGVVFEGSYDECKDFADNEVIEAGNHHTLFIYEPVLRVQRKLEVKAAHHSTRPRK